MKAVFKRVKRVSFRTKTNNVALDIMIASQKKSEIAPPTSCTVFLCFSGCEIYLIFAFA